MIIKAGLVLALLAAAFLAVRARMSNNRYRRMEQQSAVESPMTEAIAQLLGIAGGIYLSLVMAMSFLGMEQPQLTPVGGMLLDPLALASIVLACIQPVVIHFWRNRF